jgi:hypothetical protein
MSLPTEYSYTKRSLLATQRHTAYDKTWQGMHERDSPNTTPKTTHSDRGLVRNGDDGLRNVVRGRNGVGLTGKGGHAAEVGALCGRG